MKGRRFYYEIHLAGAVVDGITKCNGMLEAERRVDARAQELKEQMGQPLRGFMIVRLNRRNKYAFGF